MFEFYIFEYEQQSFLPQISVDPEIQVWLVDIEETIKTKIVSYLPTPTFSLAVTFETSLDRLLIHTYTNK